MPTVMTWVLAGLYAALLIASTFQLARILWHRASTRTFQFSFVFLCYLWSLLRTFFWSTSTVHNNWNDDFVLLVFRLPINIQFATFSLVILFYAHLVHRADWEAQYRGKFYATYVVCNIILLIFQIVWVFAEKNVKDVEFVPQVFSGVLFLVLMVLLAFYGWKLSHLENVQKMKVNMQFKSSSPRTVLLVTLFIFCIITSRCVYNFMSISAEFRVQVRLEDSQGALIFCLYMLWEVIPLTVILFFFKQVPRVGGGTYNTASAASLFLRPPLAVKPSATPREIDNKDPSSMWGYYLFDDPARYDSDEETTLTTHPYSLGGVGSFPNYGTPILSTSTPKYSVS